MIRIVHNCRNQLACVLLQNFYNAPFFTAWFCTNFLIFYYPLYLLVVLINNKCKAANDIVYEAFSEFKDKGFTFGKQQVIPVLLLYKYTFRIQECQSIKKARKVSIFKLLKNTFVTQKSTLSEEIPNHKLNKENSNFIIIIKDVYFRHKRNSCTIRSLYSVQAFYFIKQFI